MTIFGKFSKFSGIPGGPEKLVTDFPTSPSMLSAVTWGCRRTSHAWFPTCRYYVIVYLVTFSSFLSRRNRMSKGECIDMLHFIPAHGHFANIAKH